MIEQFLDGLQQNAHDLLLIVALFAFLIALFIVLAGLLRLLEYLFPPFSRWLDAHMESSIWDEPG